MDWKTMALVVIDMENAFIDPASPLCIKNALATVPTCGEVIEKARERKIPVFFVNRIYRKNGSDVEFTRYQSWYDGDRYLAPGSTGPLSIDVPVEFKPKEGDYCIIKPRFSAFFQTELETQEISDFNELNLLRQLLGDGKINEFYSNVNRMTELMKEQYRKYNE